MVYNISREDLAASMPTTSSSTGTTNTGTNQPINLADMYFNSRETGRTLYQSTNSIVFDNGFTTEDNASFTAQIGTEAPNNFTDNVTVNTYAIPSGATLYPLTYTYYDNYAASTKTYSPANNSKLDDGGNPYPETLPSQKSDQTKGLVTVTKVRVIEDRNNLTLGKWLETNNFYDDKGRVIQVQSSNYKGGNDIATSRYDFTGKVVSTYFVHNNASGNVNNLRVLTSMLYDHVGRLKTVTKTINDDVANKRKITDNTYDALGKLKEKKTGQKSVSDATAMEDDNYNYNIRGWLKDINWYSGSGSYASQMNSDPAINKWFSMDLSYDWGFNNNASQYNGNISGTRWKTAGDGEERAYGFAYDKANRLLKGDFTQNNSGWNTTAGVNFSTQVGDGATASSAYDENGNIRSMQQWGLQVTTSGIIDNMSYQYKQANQVSNQLLAVTEENTIAATDHKLGDFTDKNRTADDYDYDANGNLVYDKNKKITLIEYNPLNLPWRLTVENDDNSAKGTITYIYDAVGNKLEKRTDEVEATYNNNIAKQTTTSYLGGFVYENNVLQFFSHEEGRVRWTPVNGVNAFVYDYFIKDHLGNVRMVLTEEEKVDHYPTATLEGTGAGSPVENEKAYYDINNSYIQYQSTSLTTHYINDNGTNNPNTFGNRNATSSKMYKLNAATNRTGLGMLLKVMSGDKINILGKSYYNYNGGGVSNTLFDASALISAFLTVGGSSNIAVIHGATTTALNANTSGTVVPLNAFSNTNPVDPYNNVKAGIAFILFDEQFKYAGSGFDPVDASSSGGLKSHVLPPINVPKNGYIYIYCSNESNIDVFFDNLEVIDIKGPILEETHYYPFGVTMAGISSNAFGGGENKYKFNKGSELQNKEFSDGSGLELYATNFRSLDPQLGRWWQIDPKASESESPYVSMSNNPIRFNDPLGDTIIDAQIKADKNWSKAYNTFLNSKAGKRFLKLYSPGGKYGKTTIEFKIGSTGIASGVTEVFSINRKDGSASELPRDKKIDGIDKVAKGESKDRYLKFEINLREGDDMSTSVEQVGGGETILHETQHVRINQQTLITDKAMNYSFYQHRDWMKPTSSSWYQERAEFYMENKPMWKADYERQKAQGKVKDESDYIKSKVNDFFN